MIELKRMQPALVANPEVGSDVLFLDNNGVFYAKDATGTMKVYGRGIVSLTKTGTAGLVDTYQIVFDGGDTFTYTVTNAKSITSVQKTTTTGLTDTYRIEFNDGPAFDYNVANGRSIVDVIPPANAGQSGATDTYTVRFNDGPDETFIVYNGTDGLDGLVQSVNGISQPDIVLSAADVGAIAATEKGAANGVATLDGAGKVPAAQLPSFVDDVLEFANLAAFPATGETGKIYVAIDTGFTYRWSGSAYVIISANQNAFAAVTGNTGTATADAVSGSIAITGTNGISTTATDTPDGLVISPSYGTPTGLAPDGANSAGTANTFARSDHVHATPTDVPVALGASAAEGTSTSFARADHVHPRPSPADIGVASFSNIAVSGQSTVVADSATDTLTIVGSGSVTVTTDAANDTITIAGAVAAPQNCFANVLVGTSPTPTTLIADLAADTLSVNAGTGISLSADAGTDAFTINNADTGSAARTAHEQAADPHPQYTTTAEAAAAAPVQSFNGRTGSITPQQADYDAFFTTPAEAAAAAPVQSVAGKTGAVTLNNADVGLNNVRNPVAPNVHTTAPQTLNQTLTAAATMTIPANSLQAGDAFEIDVLFGTLVNTTAASNLEVAVFINGAQNAIALAALGTTAVAAPGRGGRALFKVVFRSVGAAGTALANGTVHVNALANFASNNVTAQTVNTTAAVTLDVRVRTSAATSTGTVQFAAIDQAT